MNFLPYSELHIMSNLWLQLSVAVGSVTRVSPLFSTWFRAHWGRRWCSGEIEPMILLLSSVLPYPMSSVHP